jgi:pyruvate/2-oxoglutarate dehydrogenase complex dihydrolipoamide acyltransferase (E2) component
MAVVQKIQVPLLAVNDTILTVADICMANGSAVKKGDLLLVFETSKTTYDVFAEEEGFIQYNCVSGDDYEVNEVVAIIFSTVSEVDLPKPVIQNNTTEAKTVDIKPVSSWNGETIFSITALALMEQQQVKREQFKDKDFISKDDVEQFLGISVKQTNTGSAGKSLKPSRLIAPLYPESDLVTLEKISKSKQREIDYLSDVQSTGLTSTINTFTDTEGIFHLVNQNLRYFKNSLLPLIIYESARLLKKYPVLNAYFNNGQIAYYKEVNVGFAIDIDKGLKVVKIPRAEESTLRFIEDQILLLSEKYVDDKLDIEDLSNISFTITDLSAEEVFSFRPLINRMNSAILGVSSIDEKLQRCVLSLTFDHRVTEGKLASRFLAELKQRLESYRTNAESLRVEQVTCFKCYKSMKDDLGDIGFMKCITPQGQEAFICQSCIKGF